MSTAQRAFCQFPFRWIYYCGSNKSTGKQTGKMHLCTLVCFFISVESMNPSKVLPVKKDDPKLLMATSTCLYNFEHYSTNEIGMLHKFQCPVNLHQFPLIKLSQKRHLLVFCINCTSKLCYNYVRIDPYLKMKECCN